MTELNSVQQFYAGKTVFITGGSGFMGKVLIEKLLYSCQDVKELIVLMRPKRGKSASQRVEDFAKLPVSVGNLWSGQGLERRLRWCGCEGLGDIGDGQVGPDLGRFPQMWIDNHMRVEDGNEFSEEHEKNFHTTREYKFKSGGFRWFFRFLSQCLWRTIWGRIFIFCHISFSHFFRYKIDGKAFRFKVNRESKISERYFFEKFVRGSFIVRKEGGGGWWGRGNFKNVLKNEKNEKSW